jgi:hypothetical protein
MKIWQSLALALFCLNAGLRAEMTKEAIINRILVRDEALTEFMKHVAYDQAVVVQKLNAQGQVTETKNIEMTVAAGESSQVTMTTTSEGGTVLPGRPSAKVMQQLKDSEKTQDEFKLRALLPRFEMTFLGRKIHRGRECHVLKFEPREGLPPEGRLQRVVAQMSGTLWARVDDGTIVEIEATLHKSVNLFWFFAVMKELHYVYRTQPALNEDVPEAFDLEYRVHVPFRDISQRQSVRMRNFRRVHP